jgi:hypothetical protein
MDMAQLDARREAMMDKTGPVWRCLECGRVAEDSRAKANLKRHVETHIEGISLPCNLCGHKSSSSNGLTQHMAKKHTELKEKKVVQQIEVKLETSLASITPTVPVTNASLVALRNSNNHGQQNNYQLPNTQPEVAMNYSMHSGMKTIQHSAGMPYTMTYSMDGTDYNAMGYGRYTGTPYATSRSIAHNPQQPGQLAQQVQTTQQNQIIPQNMVNNVQNRTVANVGNIVTTNNIAHIASNSIAIAPVVSNNMMSQCNVGNLMNNGNTSNIINYSIDNIRQSLEGVGVTIGSNGHSNAVQRVTHVQKVPVGKPLVVDLNQIEGPATPGPSKEAMGEKTSALMERKGEMWACRECGKVGAMWHIKRHVEVHIKDLAFLCKTCGKTSRSSHGLYQHIAKQHPEVRMVNLQMAKHKCSICGKPSKTSKGLSNHRWKYHRPGAAGPQYPPAVPPGTQSPLETDSQEGLPAPEDRYTPPTPVSVDYTSQEISYKYH